MKGLLVVTQKGKQEIIQERTNTKHFLIAARAGYQESLKDVREGFEAGYVTKDEYAHALREFQRRRDEAMSDDRGENSCHFM